MGIETPGRVKFVQTESGEIVVRPIRSVTDLRGVLREKTDGQGRSATERLQDEREQDEQEEAELHRQYVDEDESPP